MVILTSPGMALMVWEVLVIALTVRLCFQCGIVRTLPSMKSVNFDLVYLP